MESLSRSIPNATRRLSAVPSQANALTLMSCRVVVLPPLQEFKKFLSATFLEEAHQRTLYSFYLGARDFGDFTIPINKASCDLLKFQIARHVGVDEDLGEFSRGDDELGYQINGVVAIAAEFCRWGLIRPELAVELDVDVRE